MRACDNPFRYERTTQLPYRPPGVSWKDQYARLQTMNFRGAVVGPHGSGKSRALERLEEELACCGRPVVRRMIGLGPVPAWKDFCRLLPPLGEAVIVLVDGADLLKWLDWQRLKKLSRSWSGLVVTSHGRRLLPVWMRPRPDAADLSAWMTQLLGEPAARRWQRQAEEVFSSRQGDLHQVWRKLYDLYFEEKTEAVSCQKTF